MSDPHPQIIFIKRRGNHEEAHHGGAWKIAFADFMTAMMAFFLVLWIINATDKNTKTIIARYFNPVKLEDTARSKKGVHGGAQPTTSGGKEGAKDASAAPEDTPSKSGDAQGQAGSLEIKSSEKPRPEAQAVPAGPVDPAAPKATMPEGQLFGDPYGSLDRIASAPPQPAKSSEVVNSPGAIVTDAFRDPFRPAGPEVGGNGAAPQASEPSAVSVAPPAGSPVPPASAAPPAPGAENSLASEAAQILRDVERKLGASANSNPGPAIDVKITSEGLLISLTDNLNFAMFPLGSAEPQAKVLQAMDAIAETLHGRPGAIILRGHTDGRAYKSASYDNWRLSSARAQMAYYMLTRAGLPDSRFERIEGYADPRLRDLARPDAAENRRIEILLREVKP